MNLLWILALCALLFVANLAVTLGVAFSPAYETRQKLLQAAVIWLLPGVGAAACWYMLREEKHSYRRASGGGEDYGPDVGNAAGLDFGSNDGHHYGDSGHGWRVRNLQPPNPALCLVPNIRES